MDCCFLHDLLALLEQGLTRCSHLQIDNVSWNVIEGCVVLLDDSPCCGWRIVLELPFYCCADTHARGCFSHSVAQPTEWLPAILDYVKKVRKLQVHHF